MPSQALFGKAGDAGARQPNQVYAAMAGARWGDGLGRAWLRYVQAGTGAFSSQASPVDFPSLSTIGLFVFLVQAGTGAHVGHSGNKKVPTPLTKMPISMLRSPWHHRVACGNHVCWKVASARCSRPTLLSSWHSPSLPPRVALAPPLGARRAAGPMLSIELRRWRNVEALVGVFNLPIRRLSSTP